MEYERSLFRIYDVLLKQRSIHYSFRMLMAFCWLIGTLELVCLITFHSLYVNDGTILAKAISHQLLSDCPSYTSPEFNLSLPISSHCSTNITQTIFPEDIFLINISSYSYEFSTQRQSIFLNKEVRERKGFQVHNITIEREDLILTGLWNIAGMMNERDTIIMNQIISVFSDYGGMMKNLGNGNYWIWTKEYVSEKKHIGNLGRIWDVFRAFYWFAIISLVTGLICRFAIVGSSAFLLALLSCPCFRFINPNCRYIAYFAFPWIGEPAYALSHANKSSFRLIMAFLLMLFVFYMMYIGASILWTYGVLENLYPLGLDERFYNLFSLIEFFSLIMIRTKKSAAFYPRITCFIITAFIIYRYHYVYGFLNMAFSAVSLYSFGLMCYAILNWEMPIFLSEGPTFDSPRLLYQQVFTHNPTALPDVWSLFYPVEGRGDFSDQEMHRIFPQNIPV
ncbi:unnamed protein product [Blepharisma stoltei]|uniref:Uncharacterized protein n=1 Tax=Blepharisma stoltei TaxID=1481888 RepID=A0AAU9JWG2_9CILI|nr:unnamed protein product [Blepharisma stoltei]